MFTRGCHGFIRGLEAFVYEGPETVEQIYERDDFFQALHYRRRDRDTSARDEDDATAEVTDVWYWYRVDPVTNDVVFEMA